MITGEFLPLCETLRSCPVSSNNHQAHVLGQRQLLRIQFLCQFMPVERG